MTIWLPLTHGGARESVRGSTLLEILALMFHAVCGGRASSGATVVRLVGLLSIGLASCAGAAASMVVKPPLQSECQRLPIKGCGELVDGVLLYVGGDKAGALTKIQQAKNENEPAQLRVFAKALRDTASLPGAGDFASPMKEIAELLDSPTAAPTTAAAATASTTGEGATAASASVAAASDIKPAAVQQDPATRALSATADFGRLTTETVDLSVANTRTPCTVAGQAALCVRSREGVIIITDVISGRSCPDRVFVGATLSDSVAFGFRWQFEASTNALTGARLSIGSGERLQVAVIPGPKGPSNSPDCFVTWSGFRPWIFAGGSR